MMNYPNGAAANNALAQAQAGAIGQQLTKAPSVTNAIADFDPVLERGAHYAERLQKIVDRLRGPATTDLPGSSGINGNGAIPVSLVGSINERRSRLVDIMNSIEHSTTELENWV